MNQTKEIISNISKGVTLRKRTDLVRTAILSVPGAIFIAIYFSILRSEGFDNFFKQDVLLILNCILPFILLYTFSIGHLFYIEKNIWIKSFFESGSADSVKTLNLSKKLFWVSLGYRIRFLIRYYTVGTVIALSFLSYFFYLMSESITAGLNMDFGYHLASGELIGLAFLLIIVPIGVFFYFYYLKIKFRFFWLIFLDLDIEKRSFASIVSEIKRMNELKNSNSFLKSAALNITVDTATNFAQFTIALIASMFRGKSTHANAAITAIQVTASEYVHQLAEFSVITGNYVLYREVK